MNIRILKIDLSETNRQLERIADLLEGILGATDPIPAQYSDFPEERDAVRAFYTDDKKEIHDYWLRKLGKEPKQ